jgi:hypothetical protein
MFGAMQRLTGLAYGLPMPVQPLEAMAVIVISQKLAPNVLYGGGLVIGVTMLALTATRPGLTWPRASRSSRCPSSRCPSPTPSSGRARPPATSSPTVGLVASGLPYGYVRVLGGFTASLR